MRTVTAALVTGASRGLGAALVEGLLARGAPTVVGVARATREDMLARHRWAIDPRYWHVACDLTHPDSVHQLAAGIERIADGPLLVVHNAAAVRSDVGADGTIDFAAWDEVTATAVGGLGHLLRATQGRLLAGGGTFAGISSFAALAPPVIDPRVAYPATKAHLDVTLRALRLAWRGRVRVVTVHLGHIGGADEGWRARLLRPSYRVAAEHVVAALVRPVVPERIALTWPYRLVFRYALPLVPDAIYAATLRALAGRGR